MSSIENKGKVIYLDNAATTKMSEEVKEAMDPYLARPNAAARRKEEAANFTSWRLSM